MRLLQYVVLIQQRQLVFWIWYYDKINDILYQLIETGGDRWRLADGKTALKIQIVVLNYFNHVQLILE